ncbi:MAG: type II toxin-antitoxin system VapC family toxin [Cyanobacteria bacterium J06638_20]
MNGEIALDTSIAIRFLNGDATIVERILALPRVSLPTVVVGELLFGAENSVRSLQNMQLYLEFIETCSVAPMGRETAVSYAQTRLALKRKERPLPMNDVWISAQCLAQGWTLATNDTDFEHVDGLTLAKW